MVHFVWTVVLSDEHWTTIRCGYRWDVTITQMPLQNGRLVVLYGVDYKVENELALILSFANVLIDESLIEEKH